MEAVAWLRSQSSVSVIAPLSMHKPTQHTLQPHSEMPLPYSSSGPDYHRLPADASEEGEDQTQSPAPRLPPLPAHVHDPAAPPEPEPENPWALRGRTSDANDDDEDEDEVEREALHLPPAAPLLPWTTVPSPVTRGGGGMQPDDGDDQSKRRRRCQQWLWLLPRFLLMPPSIFRWLPGYSKQQLLGDLLGGLTVAVMVIPQGNLMRNNVALILD